MFTRVIIGFMLYVVARTEWVATKLNKMEDTMATQAELDAAIATLQADVAAIVIAQSDAFKRLEALIAAGAPPADLSAEVANLQTLHAQLATALAAATAEVQPAPALEPAPAPEPPPTA